MPEPASPNNPLSRSGNTNFLTRKVGPLPVIAWAAIIIAAYWLYQHYQSSSATTNASGTDPSTGIPYDQELAAATQQLADQQNQSTTPTATTGQFANNDQWATAAINYLVGKGIDPSVASQAVQNYLGSLDQPNPQYQADVNSAITALGPPPDIPGPAQSNPGTVGGGGTPKPTPKPGKVIVVPKVIGMRANYAIGELQSIGLKGIGTTNRNPKHEYTVATESPAAGTKVPQGTTVKLTWKQVPGT